MCLTLVIQIHEHVARASALLARKRKTARIQHSQIPAPLQIRLVGMSKHRNLHAAILCLIDQALRPNRYAIKMTVGQKCAVFSNRNLLLAVQMGEKIIISQAYQSRFRW